jgi:hypothetical protein
MQNSLSWSFGFLWLLTKSVIFLIIAQGNKWGKNLQKHILIERSSKSGAKKNFLRCLGFSFHAW